MPTELLDPSALDPEQIAAWQELADSAIEPNPFYEPGFVLAAVGAGQRSARKLRLMVILEDGRWLACLPVVRRRHGRLLPVWEAWNGPYVFLTSPLLAGKSPGQLVAKLLAGLPRRLAGAVLELALMPDEGLAAMALHTGLLESGWQPASRSRFERAYLARRDDAAEYTAALSAHHRREANRRRRRLAEEAGAELEIIEGGGDKHAVDTFLELEASGWKGRVGTSLASDDADSRFFREMCSAFHRLGRAQILLLTAGDRKLAAECVILAGEGCFTFKIAFEEDFAKYSPGIEMVFGQIGWFQQRGLFWADSCADPDNGMINRLWPDRRQLQSVVLIEPGVRGAPARTILRLINRLKGTRHKR